jgi:hypothetical protein
MLEEHTVWNDGTETVRLVPNNGQGAVDVPTDAIASIWYIEVIDVLWSYDVEGVFLVTEAMKSDNPGYWYAVAEVFDTKEEANKAFACIPK